MKKIILLMTATLMVVSFSFAQRSESIMEKDVPSSVKTEFKKRYPNVSSNTVRWEKERNDYKAMFTHDNSYYTVEFDEKGSAHKTKMRLKEHEVPASVQSYASKHHPEETYKEVEKITDRDGKVSYSMRIKDKDVHFDSFGNEIKDKERVKVKEKEKVK